MNRDEMRSLKPQEDEKKRLARVKQYVRYIYNQAIQFARDSESTSYSYKIDHESDINDIIVGVQALFPDSSVTFRTMRRTFYDEYTCIVVDWS